MKKIFKLENMCYLLLLVVFIGTITYLKIIENNSYKKKTIKSDEWISVKQKRKLSDKLVLKEILFNGYRLYQDKNHTWYYSVISHSYNPKITYKANKNVKIAFNYKINDKNISLNKKFKIIIYTDKYYRIYNLVVTSLPIMNINHDRDIPLDLEEDVDIKLSLFDNRNNVDNRLIKSNGGIHVRGATSTRFPKKGYKISLTDNEGVKLNKSLLGMREDDDWILYPAYNDLEKVRNVFATNLWNESSSEINDLNVKNGMEYKYIELFMNDEYWGLYALGYPIDRKQLNLSKKDALFKKKTWYPSEKDVIKNTSVDKLEGYELKNKVKDEVAAWDLLKKYYYNLQTKDNIRYIYNLVDINNEIDYYLFINFVQGSDNATNELIKNFYITFKKNDDNYKVFYTPWDLDMTFGNTWADDIVNNTATDRLKYNDNIEFSLSCVKKLINLHDKKIIKLIKKRYKYLRKNQWSDKHIDYLIKRYEDDIYNSGAFLRDKNRWPGGNFNNYDEKLSKFEQYVLKRIHYFDKYVKSI